MPDDLTHPPATVPTPPAPLRADQVGLPFEFMEGVLLKTMYRTGVTAFSEIAEAIALAPGATQELIDNARERNLLEATGTMHATSSREMGYRLSDGGKEAAKSALSQSEYYGPLPVPLEDYAQQAAAQSIRRIPMSRQRLMSSMGHLILPDGLIDQLGPAVGAGRSILMYGPPGNGKSSISNGIRDAIGDQIFVPHAIYYSGQVITVFDPIVHTPVDDQPDDPGSLRRRARPDPRYILCQRPVVITGGELKLSMLDLVYNHTARTYQASLQLKATGGVFIVDDLGRQEEPPQALVNRWIVPLEEARDILALQSGEKFEVPFDTLVVFSTNFHPNQIFDQAALRRIFYKIKVDGPDQDGYLKIFQMVAKKKGLPLTRDGLLYLLTKKYPTIDNKFANYQPVFLIDQMLSICDFEGIAPQMRPDLIDRAWANMFVEEAEFAH